MLFSSLSLLALGSVALVSGYDNIPPSMSNSTITLSLHLTACPDKVDREQELLITFLEQVKKNEPGVLEFLLFKAPANDTFLTIEKYANQSVIDHHLSTPWIQALLQAEIDENTKCAENQVLIPLDEVYEIVRHPHYYH